MPDGEMPGFVQKVRSSAAMTASLHVLRDLLQRHGPAILVVEGAQLGLAVVEVHRGGVGLELLVGVRDVGGLVPR
jgi:hypothetical protein